jgi:integrase
MASAGGVSVNANGHSTNPLATISPADLQILAQVEHHFLGCIPGEGRVLELAGRALLSAMLFGGLNDPAAWSGWLVSAMKVRTVRSHEGFWFQIAGKSGPHIYRMWYPDPVTGCHLRELRSRWQRYGFPSSPDLSPEVCLKHVLKKLAEESSRVGELLTAASRGPFWLNEACGARLYLRVPGMLAEHAAGKTRTHARRRRLEADEDTLQKLADFLATAGPPSAWRLRFTDHALLHLREDFFPNDSAVFDSSQKLRARMLGALDKQLSKWSKRKWQNCIHRHMLLWLRQRLDTRARSALAQQGHIRPATARGYLSELASYNWRGVRLLSITSEDGVEALKSAFDHLEDGTSYRSPKQRNMARATLTSFSIYLHAQNEAIPIRTGNSTQGQRKQVPRLTVLDRADFMRLLGLLEDWGASPPMEGEQGRPQRVQACILAAILMFRTGLRGREVTNLALNDIAFEGPFAELLVRGNAARSNKNQYARRILPLHVLLEPAELELLRQRHADRCNEEFRMAPRARLFPAAVAAPLRVDQYLLEPLDAAIRLLFEGPFKGRPIRKRPGYWYALASPLRHSFANHLIASLLLPDEPLNLPPPQGLTPDLVSIVRKQRLSSALLRPKQHGLAIMQAVRYVMGHATYKRALETYIHNVDWLLAAHLWRDVHQPPMSKREIHGLLGPLQPPAGSGEAEKLKLLSDRQLRRQRELAARQHSARSMLPRPRRGRPPVKVKGELRRLSTTYSAFLHKQLQPTVFGRRAPAGTAVLVSKQHDGAPSELGWLALHNFLCLRAKNVGPKEAAEQLAVPEAICRRWARRADELATIRKHRYVQNQDRSEPRAADSCRFPQLSAVGFPHPRGAAAKLIEGIWRQRSRLEKPRRWVSIQRVLARWQLDPPRVKSPKSLQQRASFYRNLGIPADMLFVRVAGAGWERFASDGFAPPYDGAVFQLSPVQRRGGDREDRLLHNSVLHALLMLLIASEHDFEILKKASTAPTGSRLPARKRPPRRAKVEVRIEDIPPGPSGACQRNG